LRVLDNKVLNDCFGSPITLIKCGRLAILDPSKYWVLPVTVDSIATRNELFPVPYEPIKLKQLTFFDNASVT